MSQQINMLTQQMGGLQVSAINTQNPSQETSYDMTAGVWLALLWRVTCPSFPAWRGTPTPSSGTLVPLSTLACHTFELKWHAIVDFFCWRATPSSSSGMPLAFLTSLCLWKLVLACHAQGLACHALASCLARLLWKVELEWHAQGLACHAPFVSEWFLCLACHATSSSGMPQCFALNDTGVPRLVAQVARPSEEWLACHAHDLVLVPVVSMPCLSLQVARHSEMLSVPCHTAQVACPWICELFKLGMPRLGSQVARPSDFLGLACHAFDTKWHAIVKVLLGIAWNSSLDFSTGVPHPAPGVPRQCIFVAFASSGTPVSHAQLLVCLPPNF
ncbi:hypothetical protein AHAS_Ahas19G0192300 [Arachis hypogaea]